MNIDRKIYKWKCGVYKIICTVTNKFYIGSSNEMYGRFIAHRRDLRKNCHPTPPLQHAWNKYGEKAFEIHIIEECPNDPLKLLEKEQYYCDTLKPYFNCKKDCTKPPPHKKRPVNLINYRTGQQLYFNSLTEASKQTGLLLCQVGNLVDGRINHTGDWCLDLRDVKKYKLHDSTGKVYTFFSPRHFADEHKLDRHYVMTLLRGVSREYKGWYLDKPRTKRSVKSPQGIIYTFNNTLQFARKYNLQYDSFMCMLRGKRKQYRGWTLP